MNILSGLYHQLKRAAKFQDDRVEIDFALAEKIEAALRDGQTLAYKAEAYLTLTNPGWSRPQKELTDAIKAWDDATKEDV